MRHRARCLTALWFSSVEAEKVSGEDGSNAPQKNSTPQLPQMPYEVLGPSWSHELLEVFACAAAVFSDSPVTVDTSREY